MAMFRLANAFDLEHTATLRNDLAALPSPAFAMRAFRPLATAT
jgi:hypothetical protein